MDAFFGSIVLVESLYQLPSRLGPALSNKESQMEPQTINPSQQESLMIDHPDVLAG
jgi:hypothetical protein